MKPVPVTVLVAVKNEAANIRKCLDSVVGRAVQVLVLDSHSTDGTADLAAAAGAEVMQFTHAGGYPKKRQWALDTLDMGTEWVFLLDADEEVPLALWDEIAVAVADPDAPNGFLVTKGFHFLGRRFRFGGFSFAAVLLIRRGKARFERLVDDPAGGLDMEVHERVIVDGPVGRLRTPLIHDDFKGLEAYIDRHNRYSTWEARLRMQYLATGEYGEARIRPRLFGNAQERRRFLKRLIIRLPGESFLWFAYHYVLRLGFIEGRPGWIAARLRSDYIAAVRAKMYEMAIPGRSVSSSPKQRPKRLWQLAGCVVITVLLLELILALGFGLGNPPLLQADPEIGYVFQPDQNLRRFGNRVAINRFHQRSGPVETKPANGTHRVLCVGDSVTWGGVLTDQNETYPELLAEHLRQALPGHQVEVLNASAGSWGIGNQAAYLRRFGTFGSRWLVLQIGSHDLLQATSTSAAVGQSPSHPDHKPWCATAELIERYAWPRVRALTASSSNTAPAIANGAEAFAGNMRQLDDAIGIAKASGAGVVVLHTPDRNEVSPLSGPWATQYDSYRAEFLERCRAAGVPVVNLVEQWRAGARDPGEYFRDDVHPNPAGNAAIAEALWPSVK